MKQKTDRDFINFLHKELVELMYDREIQGKQAEEILDLFHQIIHKWEQKND